MRGKTLKLKEITSALLSFNKKIKSVMKIHKVKPCGEEKSRVCKKQFLK
jgi:hypothetical protein